MSRVCGLCVLFESVCRVCGLCVLFISIIRGFVFFRTCVKLCTMWVRKICGIISGVQRKKEE